MSGLTARRVSLDLTGRRVLDDVAVSLPRGTVTGIIGPNGAGKSSLLRVLVGLVEAPGMVLLDGEALPPPGTRARARRLGYLPQAHQVHWPLSVRRTVELGLMPHLGPWQRPSREQAAVVDAVLEHVALADRAGAAVDTLSGGERARAMLARVLVTRTPVILADEPVAALDPAHQISVMRLLRQEAHRHGRVVGVVLHDLTLAARYCDRLLLLEGGRVVEAGRAADVLGADTLDRVYGISFGRMAVAGASVITPLDPMQETVSCPSN